MKTRQNGVADDPRRPPFDTVHWIQFRLCVLAYRCLHGTAAAYLSNSLHSVADIDARRRLRSADTSTLLVPSTRRSTVGDRAFPVAAARAWNALPVTVRDASTLRSADSLRLTCIAVLLTNSSSGSAYRALSLSFTSNLCTVLPQRF